MGTMGGNPFDGRQILRQRVLDSIVPLVPLTVISGLPGTAKGVLMRQLYDQLASAHQEVDPPVILVDFPRRRMGDKEAVALAVDAVLAVAAPSSEGDELASRLRRGQFDIRALEEMAQGMIQGGSRASVLLANYEWQASPLLERLLVEFVHAGFDIVCTLVDSSSLEAFAEARGVSTRILTDVELVLTKDEVASLAVSLGIDPTPELVTSVVSQTAGHPMLALAMLLRLEGVERVIVEGRSWSFLRRDADGGLVPVAVGEDPAVRDPDRLIHVDPSGFGPDELRSAAALLRQEEFPPSGVPGLPPGLLAVHVSRVRAHRCAFGGPGCPGGSGPRQHPLC